jgi:hypothetical protein
MQKHSIYLIIKSIAVDESLLFYIRGETNLGKKMKSSELIKICRGHNPKQEENHIVHSNVV